MRIILYLGKGGVGKTTIASATALRCAKLGYRTLIVSTDIAHNLADVLDCSLAPEPLLISENLWAQEINVLEEIRTHWHELWDYLATILRRKGVRKVIAEELAIVPGMEEVTSLLHIYRQSREQNFDVIVVDAAPTGETIRLLTVPETFQWYTSQFSSWKQDKVFGSTPTHEIFDLLTKVDAEMKALRQILINPSISSYRIVFNPEKIVIKETQRAITYLNLFGYCVDAAIINRVLPMGTSSDAYWQRLQEIKQHYLSVSYDIFAPLPLFEVPWYNEEVIGKPALEILAHDLWNEKDPTQLFWQGSTQKVEERGDAYVLCIPLPHVEINKVEVIKRSGELFITIGNFKRELGLPHVLAAREVTTAELTTEGILEIYFLAISAKDRGAGFE
jgi:arsenite/tail-anchored protein-transporting ATPase